MLSDKLKLIAIESEGNSKCRIPAVLKTLSRTDAKALIGALGNLAISERKICGALRDEGISVSRDAVRHARSCMSNHNACKCSILTFGDK